MKKNLKVFILTSLSFLMIYLYHTLNKIRQTQEQILDSEIDKGLEQLEYEVRNSNPDKEVHNGSNGDLKYILQWTDSKTAPFMYMGQGQKGFIERKCEYINCFVTDNKSLLGDVTKFDVVAFAGPQWLRKKAKPRHRSPLQKYVFASIESAEYYPVCRNKLDNFFNWTWTYKLDSDSRWGYIVVKNSVGNIIGPKIDMNWMKKNDMDPVSDEVMVKLKNKKKAAAWFVSNCRTKSHREKLTKDLHHALKVYNLGVDIFGTCGKFECTPLGREAECGKMIEQDYYFYLSFENSFAEDYVTEKLLHGLKNYAVPIVYGGANYSR